MGVRIVIDGYNLIKNSRTFDCSWKEMEQARKLLIQACAVYMRKRSNPVVVVFDAGKSNWPQQQRDLVDGVEIIYSSQGETADQVIMGLCDEWAGGSMTIVTADREIIEYASNCRFQTVSPFDFERKLLASGRPQYLDTAYDDCYRKDEEEPDRRKNKKGPSRRLSKKERRNLKTLKRI